MAFFARSPWSVAVENTRPTSARIKEIQALSITVGLGCAVCVRYNNHWSAFVADISLVVAVLVFLVAMYMY